MFKTIIKKKKFNFLNFTTFEIISDDKNVFHWLTYYVLLLIIYITVTVRYFLNKLDPLKKKKQKMFLRIITKRFMVFLLELKSVLIFQYIDIEVKI